MAFYESELRGDFDELLAHIHETVMGKSMSASFEHGSDFGGDDNRCAVRVYERYSAFGSNRVSLSVTLAKLGGRTYMSAVTSGGSQAMFFNINTVGEERFLRTLCDAMREYEVDDTPEE